MMLLPRYSNNNCPYITKISENNVFFWFQINSAEIQKVS